MKRSRLILFSIALTAALYFGGFAILSEGVGTVGDFEGSDRIYNFPYDIEHRLIKVIYSPLFHYSHSRIIFDDYTLE